MNDKKQKFLLGIGAPRCGTTWAYHNLLDATDIYMPPLKELRYFFGKRRPDERESAHKKIMASESPRVFDTEFAKNWISLEDGDPTAYKSLFPKDQPVGEISPIYSVAPQKQIDIIKEALSAYDAKVFYFMRNPLQRDLSHIYFSLHRQASVSEERPLSDYEEFIRRPLFIRRSDYKRTVRLWRAAFRKNLRLFYYDDLTESPSKFFTHFCNRLEIDYDIDRLDQRPKNKSGSASEFVEIKIPESVQLELKERYLLSVPEMKFLPERISEKWLSEISAFKPE